MSFQGLALSSGRDSTGQGQHRPRVAAFPSRKLRALPVGSPGHTVSEFPVATICGHILHLKLFFTEGKTTKALPSRETGSRGDTKLCGRFLLCFRMNVKNPINSRDSYLPQKLKENYISNRCPALTQGILSSHPCLTSLGLDFPSGSHCRERCDQEGWF